MAQSTLLGRVLHGRYRLELGIGSGASADVYRALDLELDRRVAVKLVHPGLASDERFLRHFQGEARAVAALNHPGIVQIHDWGRDEGQPFLVLEYLAGGSLRDLLARGVRLGPSEVALIGAQTARALEFAHSKGIVHRDIKPANLLFDETGDVHITDFGLARAMADATWTEHVGVVFGTARYASPEQASGENIGTKSDVYSLAIVCYEALVGEAPFVADTPLATLMARTRQPLPTPPQLGQLTSVLQSATVIDPNDRIDAAELAGALEAVSADLPAPDVAGVLRPPSREREFYEVLDLSSGRSASDDLTVVGGPEEDATAAFVLAVPETDASGELPPAARPKRATRFRRLRWVALAVVVAALVAVGGFAYEHDVVYGHTVPRLDGLSMAAANRAITGAGLHLSHVANQYSLSVPAGLVISQSAAPGTRVRGETKISVIRSLGHAPVAVPSVIGSSSGAAETALRQAGLVMHATPVHSETVPVGDVVAATPAAGKVNYGAAVAVQVSTGPQPRTIPELGGLSYAQARSDLVSLRLVPKRSLEYSNVVPSGQVISSEPAFGSTGIPVGSAVTITVSRGPQLVAVPTVAGDLVAAAVSALQAVGLNVTEEIGPPFATKVSTTDPAAGATVRPGTDVTLYTS